MIRRKVLVGLLLLGLVTAGCSKEAGETKTVSVTAATIPTGEQDISGSYLAVDNQEELVLIIAGTSGQLVRQKQEGQRLTEQVTLNVGEYTMLIGKEEVSYRIKDGDLLLTEREKSDLFQGGFLSFERQ